MTIIKLKAEVAKELRYKENGWGIYSFIPLSSESKVKLSSYGNFTVTGVVFPLKEGMEYELEIEETNHPKYGDGYTFVTVKQDRPKTPLEQHAYLKMMVSEKLYESIYNKYSNEPVLDLIKNDQFDYSDIKGIGSKTYKKMRESLLNNLDIQDAIIELKDLEINYKQIKKLIDHFGSVQMVISKVKANVYSLCEVKGFGFKKVDKYAMNRGDSKTNKNRIEAGISYILSNEEALGHCYMSIDYAIEKGRELLSIPKVEIENCINNLNEELFYLEDGCLARKYTFEAEEEIKSRLESLLKASSSIKVNYKEEKLKGIEALQGFSFTDEQKQAIKLALENNVLIINGKGGVGKTSALKGIIKMMEGFTHSACALSGKASKVLKANGLNSSTIHRLLKYRDGEFFYNKDNPLPYDIVVVDEASMINTFLFRSLIRAVRKGSKLIILGDSGQLASIGVGAVFRDLIHSTVVPKIELTQVQRQAAMSGILSAANQIRNGEQIIHKDENYKKSFGELKDLLAIPLDNRDEIVERVLSIAKKFVNTDLEDFQVITGRKKGVATASYELNLKLQKILNGNNKDDFIQRNGYQFYEGDKVIQCGNIYNLNDEGIDIFNGTLGKIVKIEKGVTVGWKKEKVNLIKIKFEDRKDVVSYTEEQMDMIELAYAITCHKSQGSTIKNVLFVFDYSSYQLLSKEFVYTGLTRAAKACVLLCELRALRHAIRTKTNDNRRTFLSSLLK